MQKYLCYKCKQDFVPLDEYQCHMVEDPKAKYNWVFECDDCFNPPVLTSKDFEQGMEICRSKDGFIPVPQDDCFNVDQAISPEARVMLLAGIESGKNEPPVYLGSFAQYLNNDEDDE